MALTGPDGMSAEKEARNPITGIADCCARTDNDQVAPTPPKSVMNSRLRILIS